MLCTQICVVHRSVPYAFWHLPLQGAAAGFPVFLDINLSEQGAQTWLSWLQEGLLMDTHTRSLMAHLITYNSELKVFGAVKVHFDFQQGGSIQVTALGFWVDQLIVYWLGGLVFTTVSISVAISVKQHVTLKPKEALLPRDCMAAVSRAVQHMCRQTVSPQQLGSPW